jgi:hypothetical protein
MRNQKSSGPSLRPLKWLVGSIVVLFLGLAFASARSPDRPEQLPVPAVAPDDDSHEVLQVDANMTQQMSTPNADTGRQNHLNDPQLTRSTDQNYLRRLEQHQADIDRMLARQGP